MTATGDCVREDRLREDIEATAAAGAVETDGDGRARTVLPGTDADRRTREYFVDRLADAGLDVTVDAVGNVAGRWLPPGADPDAAPVAAGSHLDSVPEGGIFDGPLGVYGALEAVRAMRDAGVELARPVAVVSFTEEEGTRFSDGLLGSTVAAGGEDVDAALSRTDDDGATLESALAEVGFHGEGRLDAGRWDAWLELHVEQGRRLEAAGVPAGVVTDVTGLLRCSARIRGEADHAGTTSMHDRTDALAAASELILDVEAAATELADGGHGAAVGTVGALDVAPNAVNVVPGRVEVGVDVRDVEVPTMEQIEDAIRASLAVLEADRGVETTLERSSLVAPTPMAGRCREALRAAADREGHDVLSLHSGAGHDAMRVADVTDAGLLFAPSRDGASHSPREWTDWSDCAAATRILTGAIVDLAGE
jgi:N-carbamoyl-L-amino-acid hydrolase